MNLQIILTIILALLGYLVGLFIAKNTKEELKSGRKWFKLVMIVSLVIMILSLIISKGSNLMLLESIFGFIFLLVLAALIVSRKL